MLSRALSLAAVTLLIGSLAADPALAQVQNLEAGKSPSQIFAGTCNACHKSPRGLLKTLSAGSLQGFLRQHYTTSSEMASLLSAFLVSNGATDARSGASQAKEGRDAKSETKPGGRADQLDRLGERLRPGTSQEAARPDADGLAVQGESGRQGRNANRLARPGEVPPADGPSPVQVTNERGSDDRKLSSKHKLSKRGKPDSEELQPKTEAAKIDAGKEEPAKSGTTKEDTPEDEIAKVEGGMPEGSKPKDESESAKTEPLKEKGSRETSVLQADPASSATSAPPVSPSVSAAGSSGSPPDVPTVIVVAPPPVTPAGPPAPPISQ